jgi:hypothetical protein
MHTQPIHQHTHTHTYSHTHANTNEHKNNHTYTQTHRYKNTHSHKHTDTDVYRPGTMDQSKDPRWDNECYAKNLFNLDDAFFQLNMKAKLDYLAKTYRRRASAGHIDKHQHLKNSPVIHKLVNDENVILNHGYHPSLLLPTTTKRNSFLSYLFVFVYSTRSLHISVRDVLVDKSKQFFLNWVNYRCKCEYCGRPPNCDQNGVLLISSAIKKCEKLTDDSFSAEEDTDRLQDAATTFTEVAQFLRKRISWVILEMSAQLSLFVRGIQVFQQLCECNLPLAQQMDYSLKFNTFNRFAFQHLNSKLTAFTVPMFTAPTSLTSTSKITNSTNRAFFKCSWDLHISWDFEIAKQQFDLLATTQLQFEEAQWLAMNFQR